MSTTTTNLGLVKQTADEYADIDVINQNLDTIDSAVANKAAKSISVSVTLSAAAWSGSSAPYTQSVTVTGMTSSANGIVGLSSSATTTQRTAARNALICISAQGTNSLTFASDGIKPGVNLPISVLIAG